MFLQKSKWSVLLLLLSLFLLMACGGPAATEVPPTQPPPPPATATPASTPTPVPPPTAVSQPEPTATEAVEIAPTESMAEMGDSLAVDTTDLAEMAELPDLPLPDDAQTVTFDPDSGDFSFTSPAKITDLVDFYQQSLPAQGWQADQDFAIVTDTFASIDFNRDDETITLTLLDLSGSTEVMFDLSSAASLTGVELVSTGDNGSDTITPPADAPTFTISDWPTPPDATEVSLNGETLTYKVVMKLVDLAEFYRPTFELMELSTSCLDNAAEYTSMSCSMSNGNFSTNFFAFEGFDNQAEVEITFSNYYYPVDETPDSSGGDPGTLSAIDQDGLPLPSDKTGYSDESTEYSRRLIVTSPSDVSTLSDFYQAELPGSGWALESVSGGTDSADLTFSGTAGILTVAIKATGSETEITLTSKNREAAAEAGILPPDGQARLYLVNLSSDAMSVTINGQVIEVEAEAGMDSPDNAPKLDVPPGDYEVTVEVGGNRIDNQVTVAADETWGLLLDATGAAPLQIY